MRLIGLNARGPLVMKFLIIAQPTCILEELTVSTTACGNVTSE